MENNISAKLLLNLVQQKYTVYQSSFGNLLSVFGDNDQDKKIEANNALFDASSDLANILATTDRPDWLSETLRFTAVYKQQNPSPDSIVSGSSWNLLHSAMGVFDQAMEHNWNFTNQADNKYDFDKIYQSYRDKSDLTGLFNSLIETLDKMVNSGEIDSIKATSALNDLIAMLSQNQNGSYFSTMASWEFVKGFTKNYVWEQIHNIPGVKSLKKAFEKTMSDMDMEIEKLHKDIAKELKDKYQMSVQAALTYKNEHIHKTITNNGEEK